MKFVSFNINGLRARPHQLEAIVEQHQPEVIGLQETKVHDDMFPLEDVAKLGYNVFYHGQKGHYGVALLTVAEQRGVPDPKQLLRGVATNPILLGIVFGTVYALLPFTLPQIATKTISSIASLTTPLSLLSIGASFEGTKAIKKLGPTLAAAFIKTVGLAAVFLPCAVALGFRNEELVALLIMLGSPTTPSAYVMSRNMGHEGVLTSSCIALTTLLSALTLTGWIFVLRSGGYL